MDNGYKIQIPVDGLRCLLLKGQVRQHWGSFHYRLACPINYIRTERLAKTVTSLVAVRTDNLDQDWTVAMPPGHGKQQFLVSNLPLTEVSAC